MIRREIPAREGVPAAWVIILQIDHARLAGDLSKHWGAGRFAQLEPDAPLQWAIEHHDDGWLQWDARPQVDAETGVPRQFLEMKPAETIAIWQRSIDAAAEQGPLEGYLVAGHFCRLGRRGTEGKQDDPAWRPFIDFLDDYEARAHTWEALWQSADEQTRTAEQATAALDQLQFFDTFSLWFCCSESTQRETVATPSGVDLTLSPRGSSHVRLSPWPLSIDMLELSVPGRMVAARRYVDADDLASAPSHPITLRWRLTPG